MINSNNITLMYKELQQFGNTIFTKNEIVVPGCESALFFFYFTIFRNVTVYGH